MKRLMPSLAARSSRSSSSRSISRCLNSMRHKARARRCMTGGR
ncbi:Uncharacterised protein [Vibrio cholerae]|nr:Uncharacterised protein [Vibrio cholerae]